MKTDKKKPEISGKAKKINLFDILIVIALAGILLAVVVRGGYISDLLLADAHSVTYTVEIAAADEDAVADIAENLSVYPENSYISIGKTSRVTVSDASVTVRTASGSAVVGTLPGKKDVTIVIDTEASVKDSGVYAADGTLLKENSTVRIRIKNTVYTVKIEKVTVNE